MLYQYDPKKHNIIVGGFLITGLADGTFLNVEATSDSFTMVNGIAITTRVRQNDDSASIILTLQYTSPANAVLEGFRQVDLGSGLGAFNFVANDSVNPGNKHVAGTAWVRRPPSFTGSKDAPNYEWTLDTDELKFNIAGAVQVIGL